MSQFKKSGKNHAAITATIRNSHTTVHVVDANGKIIASDDTAGKQDGPNGYIYTLGLFKIPLNAPSRVYFISQGTVYPMFFDVDADGFPDANVFSLSGSTLINIGTVSYIDTPLAPGQFPGRAVTESPPSFGVWDFGGATPDLKIPRGINEPAIDNLTASELVGKGINALDGGWILGARAYFAAAVDLVGTSTSNDADTARFLFALTRVAAFGFDTLPDGNPTDMLRVSDVLDRLGVADDEVRANWNWLFVPQPMVSDSPTGNEYRNFLYTRVGGELNSAVSNLNAISQSFVRVWTDPADGASVEGDYGDVLALRGTFKSLLASIATPRAYDLSGDVDAIANNDTPVQNVLAGNPTLLTLADPTKLAEAKGHLLGAIADFGNAIDFINAETDDQSDDLVALGSPEDPTGVNTKAHLAQVADSLINGATAVGSATLNLSRFFDDGVDFRSKLPPIAGDNIAGLLPDPTFDGVVLSPDLNKDDLPDGVPDILQ